MAAKTVGIKNLNKEIRNITKGLRELGKEITFAFEKVLFKGGNKIRNSIIESMFPGRRKEGPSGLPYKRGKRIHIASAPGEAPAVDTGELARSILFEVNELELEIGSAGGAPYSEFLEFGTTKSDGGLAPGNQLMAPRPFLIPAVEKHEDEIIENMGKVTTKILERVFTKK